MCQNLIRILVREGIIKWHFANTYDHENSDVGAANRSNYASMTSSPENMFSTEKTFILVVIY